MIPEGWIQTTIGQITGCVAGGTPSTAVPAYWGGSIRWMSSGELNLKRVGEVSGRITEIGLQQSSAQLVPPWSVLVGLAGQGKTRGTAAVNLIELSTNQSIAAILPSINHDSKFLYYVMDTKYQLLRDLSDGGGGRGGLNLSLIRGIEILLPPLDEQAAVGAVLWDIDNEIESLDALIAKKRDMKQAAMQQLLTGRTRLPGFNEPWVSRTFDQVLRRFRGPGRALPAMEFTSDGAIPIIDQSQAPIAGWTDRADLRINCPEGGVIVFGDHTRVIKFVADDFVVGADGTQVLLPFEGGDAQFMAYQLKRAEIPNTGYNRHFKYLKDLFLECPGLEEQQAIAEVLSDVDAEIDALVAQREKADLVKQGMMQELLSGRVRLV